MINGGGSARPASRPRPPACPTCASSTCSPRSGCPRCWRPPTSTWCRCGRAWPGPACRRSSTRSWPPAGRWWPASTRAPRWPAWSSRPVRASAVPPTTPRPSRRAVAACSTTRSGARGMGAAGRRFVERGLARRVAERYEALFAELRVAPLTPRPGSGDTLSGPWVRPRRPRKSLVRRAPGAVGPAADSGAASSSPPPSRSSCVLGVSPHRSSRGPSDEAQALGSQGVTDHWHAAYGIYICGTIQPAVDQRRRPQRASTPTATASSTSTRSAQRWPGRRERHPRRLHERRRGRR